MEHGRQTTLGNLPDRRRHDPGGPTGVTVDLSTPADTSTPPKPRALWVASAGKSVVNLRPDATTPRTITGFDDANSFTMGGPNSDLYIGDAGTGVVHRYPVTAGGQPGPPRHFFGKATPGPVKDDRLRWPDARHQPGTKCKGDQPQIPAYKPETRSSIAVSPNGDMVVADVGNGRVLTYRADGAIRTVGEEKKPLVRMADFTPYPQVDVTQDPNIVSTGLLDYRIDPAAPGRNWKLRSNWRPNGPAGGTTDKLTQRRKLSNGKTYMYLYRHDMNRIQEVVVYEYSEVENTLKVVTTIGMKLSSELFVGYDNKIVDGVISDDELELRPNPEKAWMAWAAPSAWVDVSGNIWFIVHDKDHKRQPTAMMVPVKITDGQPKYAWPSKPIWEHTMPADDSAEKLQFLNVKVDDTSGDVYRHGWSRVSPLPQDHTALWFGGTTIERRSADGKQVTRIFPRCTGPRDINIYCDEANSDNNLAAVAPVGEYFYTAHDGRVDGWNGQAWFKMFTNDGLVVTSFTGANYGTGGMWGYLSWVDGAHAFTAYRYGETDRHYVLAEDSFLNRALRWRVDDVSKIERLNGGAATQFDWAREPGAEHAQKLADEARRLWDLPVSARYTAVVRALDAVDLARELAKQNPANEPKLAEFLTFIASGYVSEVKGKDAAIALLDEAIPLYRGLSQREPDVSTHRWGLANALMYRAQNLWAKNEREQGLAGAREAISVLRQLVRTDPAYTDSLGSFLLGTSNYLAELKRIDEAVTMTREAEQIYRELSQSHPDRHQYRDSMAYAVFLTGGHQWNSGDRPTGMARMLDAIEFWRQLAVDDSAYRETYADRILAPTLDRLVEIGDRAKAFELAKDAVRVLKELEAEKPGKYKDKLAAAEKRLSELQQ